MDRIELIDMPELKGRWVSDAIQFLRERFGRQAGIICIGPAGEMRMGAAGVAVSGPQDIQVRYAARGGLGAVMGSKGIKAIVIDDTDAPPVSVFDEVLLREAGKALVQEIMADPKTENRRKYGTPAVLMMCNELGILPTRNFSAGSFEKAGEICGDKVAEVIAERGGAGRSGTPCVRGLLLECLSRRRGQENRRLDPVREHRPFGFELRDRRPG